MKKFKKVIVALLAMVMALGCLTVAASADEAKVKVTVVWDDAAGSDVGLYVWDSADNKVMGNWPGTTMTKVNDKTYTIEVPATADKLNMIANKTGGSQTNDIKDVPTVPESNPDQSESAIDG